MEKSGRQKVSIKFFLYSETQKMDGKFWSPKNAFGAAMATFPLTNKIECKHTDYLYA